METVIRLLDFLIPYGTQSYLVIFGILIACGFGLPMPEDILLITGGILSARNITDFWLTNLVCFAGVIIGDSSVFWIGRFLGDRVKTYRLYRWLIHAEREKKISDVIAKYGDKVVFVARFLPGLRTPIFLTTGVYQLPYWKFLALDGFAALISVPAWIYVGYIFGNNLEALAVRLHKLQFGILGVVVGLIVIFGGFIYWRSKRNPA